MKKIVLVFTALMINSYLLDAQNISKHSRQTDILPNPPTNLVSSIINDSSIVLSWDTSMVSGVSASDYDVYKDSIFYGTTTSTNLFITGLTSSKTYSFTVKSRYLSSYVSEESLALLVTIPALSTVILSENFDGFKTGTPLLPATEVSGYLDSRTQIKGWSGSKIYEAGGIIKIGTNSFLGYISTPSLNLSANSGKFSLSFEAMAWNLDATDIKVYLDSILVYVARGLNNNSSSYTLKSYNIDLTGGKENSKIRFEGNQPSRGRFFLNNVLVTQGKISLPNIHVSSVACQNMLSGTKTVVEWTVQNDGAQSTQKNAWRDKVWLVPDITKNFLSTGYLLSDVLNLDSLVSGNSYHNSVLVSIPERLQGTYYLVVTSDMSNITSIDWHSAGDTIPNPYIPNISGIPYSYMKAKTGSYINSVYEEGETSDISDNFNYKKISIALPDLADLQVSSVQLQDSIIADRKMTVKATISNKGKVDIVGKSWIDRIYMSNDTVFNKTKATLLASITHTNGLTKDSDYVATFQFTAPSDTLNKNRFFCRNRCIG